tara:strand:+ start:4568 stop:4780 length:213 start_codon:yes stop_codon:yes gene_type:complete
MYSFIKHYVFEATYWVITVVVYDNSEKDLLNKTELDSEKSTTDVDNFKMKKNTSWGHFSTGTFTPDREYY